VRRVVFDANVWVSAAAFPGSVPDQVIGLARDGLVQSVISEAIIQQMRRTLLGEKFAVPGAVVAKLEAQIRGMSEVVSPAPWLAVIIEKPSDNRVLECAVAGRADTIVTGDRKHLLRLGRYEGISLVAPKDFLQSFEG
jgi:putative PIN family toxin of toxin-antitoxin system